MGFGGGGSGALPPHEHTNIANDGGPLDMNNATVGSLNAGSVVYSDGVALQELTIGAANTVLESSGAVPQWVVGGGVSTNSLSASLAAGTWTTGSATPVAVTGMSVTATGTGGLIIANANASINDAVANRHGIWIASAGTVSTPTGAYNAPNNNDTGVNSTTLSIARASQAVAAYANTQGGTVQWNGGTAQGGCNIMVSEIS